MVSDTPKTRRESDVPITLCIINHNGLAYLKTALLAVQALSWRFDQILVVDNASTDGSLEYLNSLDQVDVVALPDNTGPAGARNAGLCHSRNDTILFQDNDVQLREGVVEALYQGLYSQCSILMTLPRVLYLSDPEVIQFEGADCHLLGMMILREANQPASVNVETYIPTTSMVSACFMLDRGRWQSQGEEPGQLFDERFIFNLEDHDLGVRANLLGFTLLAVPNAVVLHGAGTEGLSYRPGRAVSSTRMYCLIRNRWWIVYRYYSIGSLILLMPLLLLFELMQLLGMMVKGYGREWRLAAVDTWQALPELARERRYFQLKRVREDRDILKAGSLPLTSAIKDKPVNRLVIALFQLALNAYWLLVKKIL